MVGDHISGVLRLWRCVKMSTDKNHARAVRLAATSIEDAPKRPLPGRRPTSQNSYEKRTRPVKAAYDFYLSTFFECFSVPRSVDLEAAMP